MTGGIFGSAYFSGWHRTVGQSEVPASTTTAFSFCRIKFTFCPILRVFSRLYEFLFCCVFCFFFTTFDKILCAKEIRPDAILGITIHSVRKRNPKVNPIQTQHKNPLSPPISFTSSNLSVCPVTNRSSALISRSWPLERKARCSIRKVFLSMCLITNGGNSCAEYGPRFMCVWEHGCCPCFIFILNKHYKYCVLSSVFFRPFCRVCVFISPTVFPLFFLLCFQHMFSSLRFVALELISFFQRNFLYFFCQLAMISLLPAVQKALQAGHTFRRVSGKDSKIQQKQENSR